MNRDEFIEWLKFTSGFEQKWLDSDNEWRELMNYADYIWDELTVEDDKVIFYWEEMYWGGSNSRSEEYSFKEFIRRYESFELK